jgi:hypothetical protein
MSERLVSVVRWLLFLALVGLFVLPPLLSAVTSNDEPKKPNTTDCRVTDYKPYGPLPAGTPFENRTCSKAGDDNFVANLVGLDNLRYDVVVGYVCRDGSRSGAAHAQGACSDHGGIRSTIFYNTKTKQYSVIP